MARSFLKVYFDFDEKTEELSDTEKSRLLLAMLRYAITGQKPSLNGNERFLFATFKGEIDRDIAAYNTKINNGVMGGRPTHEKAKESENNRKEPNESETKRIAKNKEEEEERRIRINKENQNARARDFESFWAEYPRHTNKKAAMQAFLKLNPGEELMQTILAALSKQKQSAQWTKDDGQFIPHPATWLNGKRWEDELPLANTTSGKRVSAQNYTQREYSEDELLSVSDDLIAEARSLRGA